MTQLSFWGGVTLSMVCDIRESRDESNIKKAKRQINVAFQGNYVMEKLLNKPHIPQAYMHANMI